METSLVLLELACFFDLNERIPSYLYLPLVLRFHVAGATVRFQLSWTINKNQKASRTLVYWQRVVLKRKTFQFARVCTKVKVKQKKNFLTLSGILHNSLDDDCFWWFFCCQTSQFLLTEYAESEFIKYLSAYAVDALFLLILVLLYY